MLGQALVFCLITFAVTMVVSLLVAILIKFTAALLNRGSKGAAGAGQK